MADGSAAALVIGGARSGKSREALRLASLLRRRPVMIATARITDGEMAARIARHRAERGPEWLTVEEPIDLPGVLAAEAAPDRVVVVDCLTLWLSNLMLDARDPAIEARRLCSSIEAAAGPVILVANEVGLGIVPDNALARAFRDEAGWLNQAVAAQAGMVLFMAAGLPMVLKRPASGPWSRYP
jgi:adenosylcobinamide kinase/adenosylcobinamide-phosphate guanylyltransferase